MIKHTLILVMMESFSSLSFQLIIVCDNTLLLIVVNDKKGPEYTLTDTCMAIDQSINQTYMANLLFQNIIFTF